MVRMAAGMLVGLLLGPASVRTQAAIKVETRDEMGSTRYASFAFVAGTPASRADAQDRIVAAVERELEAKGMVRVFGGAEIHVVTHVIVDRHTLEDLRQATYFEYWSGVHSIDAFDLRAGTIVVDLVDTARDRRVWRGVASMPVKGSVDKNLEMIDRIVKKLFRSFPPQAP